ncbi:hypothetical protein [Halobacillus litoralis]|uniref:hypothetical protein n=1 Tax=Halobacillus litoralis TaxID=45668 RepID=UPI001CD37361|nr:hypothetical protein [Halobacillus litoralis]MCA1021544.1 hypothetical protein [Halobacillus litoralis]
MDKTKQLAETVQNYPDHKLIFMYPEEGSDYPYTMGYPSKVIVDEYWVDDERCWLRKEDEYEMFDHYADNKFDELFPNVQMTNDEQDKILEKETNKFIEKQDWKKCICVYIHY